MERAAKRQRIIKLNDGRVLEFMGTRRGNAEFTTDTKWRRIGRSWLPSRLKSWIPTSITMGPFHASSNRLTVYLLFKSPPETNKTGFFAPKFPGYPNEISIEVEDQNGFRYPRADGCDQYYDPSLGYTLIGLHLEAFPRRQSDFIVHLLDRREGTELAAFHVSNTSGNFPVWQPSTLPITLTNGPVKLTLLKLEERRDGGERVIVPVWQFESTSPEWRNAMTGSQVFFDVTGNEGQCLAPTENAWKLRVLAKRENSKDFNADEKLVLTNLAVPPAGKYIPIDQKANRTGVSLNVMEFAGPGTYVTWSGGFMATEPSMGSSFGAEEWDSESTFFLVGVGHRQPHDDIQFRIRDDHGRDLEYRTNNSADATSIIQPQFDPPPGTKSVLVEVIVNRPLVFEFLVNPKDVRRVKE